MLHNDGKIADHSPASPFRLGGEHGAGMLRPDPPSRAEARPEIVARLEWHPNLRAGLNTEKPEEEENPRLDRAKEWLHIHGRLSPGVSVEQASAAIAGVTARLAKDHPATNEYRAGVAKAYDPLGALTRSTFRMVQAVGLTLTGMVLLVVALNISGMM